MIDLVVCLPILSRVVPPIVLPLITLAPFPHISEFYASLIAGPKQFDAFGYKKMYFITLQFQHVNSLSRPFYGQPGNLVPILDDGQGKDQFNWANSRLFAFAKRVMRGFTWDELLEPLVHLYLILFYFIVDIFRMFSYCCCVCANLSLPQAII